MGITANGVTYLVCTTGILRIRDRVFVSILLKLTFESVYPEGGRILRFSFADDLAIDYQFTFNLSKKEDRQYRAINFKNSPPKHDIDAEFSITCSVLAKMNITIKKANIPEIPLLLGANCTTSMFKHRFGKTEYGFGKSEYGFGGEENNTLTTFYVYVYDFQPPVWIQISFSQYSKLNLQQFFITFCT